jgi:hypothetical protein
MINSVLQTFTQVSDFDLQLIQFIIITIKYKVFLNIFRIQAVVFGCARPGMLSGPIRGSSGLA